MKSGRRCVHCSTDFVTFFPFDSLERAHIWDYKIDHDSCPLVQRDIDHFNDVPPEMKEYDTLREEREERDWEVDMLCKDCKIEAEHRALKKNIPTGYRWRNRRKKLPRGRPREK